MMPPTAPGATPAAPSPLAAMLKQRAGAAGKMQHSKAPTQSAGAPMPLNVGGHAAPRYGHAPAIAAGC